MKHRNNVVLDLLTGEEFKTLIERFTQDGKIDTIPELLQFLSDIPEGKTLGEYIAEHGGQLGPDSVGKEELKDKAVGVEKLDDDVKDKMTIIHDSSTGGLRMGGYAQAGEVPNNK